MFLYKTNFIYGDTMEYNKNVLLKSYLSNIQVSLITAAYTRCWDSWRDTDYTPDYNKFYLICNDEGWLKIGGQEYFPKPSQFFVMPAGVLQSYSTISKNTFEKYWCHFTATIGDMNLFDIIQLPHYINIPDRFELERLFRDLISCNENNEIASPLRVKALLLEIISYFIENTVIEKILLSTSTSVEKLNHVLNYIETHLSEDISVEELASIVHFHPNYFIRFFKKHLGTSPIHYINRIRLEKAKNLLGISDMAISEIADKIGFNDLFYFSRKFKSHTGFSPSEFRNIHYRR